MHSGTFSHHCRALRGLRWLVGSLVVAWFSSPGSVLAQSNGPQGTDVFHQLVICTDGSVKGWGSNALKQLGTASSGGVIATPTTVPLVNPAVVVQAVVSHGSSYAVGADGSVWAWGDNANGVLGVGSGVTSPTATALQVPGLANVVSVASGYRFCLALCADGTVWSWGEGSHGCLGTGSSAVAYTPQHISPTVLHDIRSIACGEHFALALDAYGHVWSWGRNLEGQLGTGAVSTVVQYTPVQIATLNNIRRIEADDYRGLALTPAGQVYDWGRNTNGELGLGSAAPAIVTTPTSVGTFAGVVAAAMCDGATMLVKGNGSTVVWGFNNLGQFGTGSSSPVSSTLPVTSATPTFSPNVQITGRNSQFLSIEYTGQVKTWGYGGSIPLGYTPSAPGIDGGSCVPTPPRGICPAVPAAGFPACGSQRTYYQNPGATYEAVRHGYTLSPAEIGTYGTVTTIDASLAPYNGTITFDGTYHVRGNVRFIGGTVNLNDGTKFYVDGTSGLAYPAAQTTLEVQNAALTLTAATLQANCPGKWGGVVLSGRAKLYTDGVAGTLRRSVIRDAATGVNSLTADWTVSNTNEYYLNRTDFLNNDTGLHDFTKGTALYPEGAHYCTFSGGTYGIVSDITDQTPGNASDYDNALFDNNTFSNLNYGISGNIMNNAHFAKNTFTDCYLAAMSVYQYTTSEIVDNTITVPTQWPAALLALYAGYPTVSKGIEIGGSGEIVRNIVQGATANPTTNSIQQIGLYRVKGDVTVSEGNIFRYLDQGVVEFHEDYYGSTHTVINNTFRDNAEAMTFYPYYAGGQQYKVKSLVGTIRCNTIENPGNISGAKGIWIKNKAGFWDKNAAPINQSYLGSSTLPNGNRFSGITLGKAVVNDNNTPPYNGFNYYRYTTLQEDIGTIKNLSGSFTTGTAVPVSPSVARPAYACGTSVSPGVYQRSSAPVGLSLTALQSKLDSLQRPGLSTRLQKTLLAEAATACERTQNLALLENGLHPLAASQPSLYTAGALLLLNAYRHAQQEPAAQRVLADLQRRDTQQDVELTNYLRYMEATGHLGSVLPRPGRTLAPADQALLRQAAASGTAIARLACSLLRFYEPRCACRLLPETTDATALATGTGKQNAGALLGPAYPNPAQNILHLPYVLPHGSAAGEIVVYDAMGRRVAAKPLAGTSGEAQLPVQTWADGLYNLVLLAEGQVVSSQRIAIAHE